MADFTLEEVNFKGLEVKYQSLNYKRPMVCNHIMGRT